MCASFNYQSKSDGNTINCQLTNKTKTYTLENNGGNWSFYQDAHSVRNKINKLFFQEW